MTELFCFKGARTQRLLAAAALPDVQEPPALEASKEANSTIEELPAWCEEEGLLHGIYSFTHLPAPSSQDPRTAKALSDVLRRFLAHHAAHPSLCTPELLAGLPKLSVAAELLASDLASFQPDYGCLLLALPPAPTCTPAAAACGGNAPLLPGPVVGVGELHLHLVCLDGWRFEVHSALWQECKEQRWPVTAAERLSRRSMREAAPQTGLKALLTLNGAQDPQLLHHQALAHLHAWLAARQAELLRPDTAVPATVNAVMTMISAATGAAEQLADDSRSIAPIEAALEGARAALERAVQGRALREAEQFDLPPAGRWPAHVELPHGVLPPPAEARSDASGLAAARARAARALGSQPLLREGCTFVQALVVVKYSSLWASNDEDGAVSDAALQHRMRLVERHVFPRMVALQTGGGGAADGLGGVPEALALSELADAYWQDLHALLGRPAAVAASMRVEIQSRGVLMDAALAAAGYLSQRERRGREAFCLRSGCDATFELAEEFGLGCQELLSKYAAHQAAAEARVSAHWSKVQGKQRRAAQLRVKLARLEQELQVLSSQLADATASRDAHLYGTWEYKSAGVSVESADRRVRSKRSEVKATENALTEELKPPRSVVQPLPRNPKKALRWLFWLHMGEAAPRLRCLARAAFAAQQLLVWPCGADTKEALKVPDYPLSLTKHYNTHQTNAYGDTTFDFPGTDGDVLLVSRSEVPDRSTIRPSTIDHMHSREDGIWYPDSLAPEMAWNGIPEVSKSNSGFAVPFNPFAPLKDGRALVLAYTEQLLPGDHQLQRYMDCTAFHAIPHERGNVAIAAPAAPPGGRLYERELPLGAPVVRTLVRQAVYHLGELQGAGAGRPAARVWRDGWEGDTLPALFEELSSLADHLSDTPREQEAVALLGELAAHLSEHIPRFRALARQFARMTAAVANELDSQLEALRGAAGASTAAAGAGVAGAAGGASSGSGAGAEAAVAAIVKKQLLWRAMAIRCHAMGELTGEDAAEMVELMVLINHGFVFQDDPAVREQLSSAVAGARQAAAARAPGLAAAARRAQSRVLTAAVRRVLARVPDGLDWRQHASLAGLTSFEAEGRDEQGAEHLYSINIVTGVVLFDGAPPNRLPADITGHPLYRRTFGDTNFEVFRTNQGLLQTARPAGGRFYDFLMGSSGRLVVTERHQGRALELLDAGQDHACAGWGEALPQRLRKLHSHWLWRGGRGGDDDVIEIRPLSFLQRDVHFVVRCTTASADAAGSGTDGGAGQRRAYDCRRVPPHLRARPWHELLAPPAVRAGGDGDTASEQLPDQLVLTADDAVLRVLSKYEDPRFIHVHRPAGPAAQGIAGYLLRYELPRFALEFELCGPDGALRSLQRRGYVLAARQQLADAVAAPGDGVTGVVDYTLPGFSRYLVLENGGGGSGAERLVEVPAGKVALLEGGGATVEVDGSSGAGLRSYAYSVHHRLGDLRASSIPARLQLAALYAATSTLLPEPGSQMTGAQVALQLVRWSWRDTALSQEELLHLRSAAAFAGHLLPALPLACHELEASAAQLSFLGAAVHAHPAGAGEAAEQQHALAPKQPHTDAATQYLIELSAGGWWGGANPRALLTPGEAARLLGARAAPQAPPSELWPLRLGQARVVDVPECPVPLDAVEAYEQALLGLVLVPAGGSAAAASGKPYPLTDPGSAAPDRPQWPFGGRQQPPPAGRGGGAARPLEAEMRSELRASWDEHRGLVVPEEVSAGCRERVRVLQARGGEVQAKRCEVEHYLLASIDHVPAGQTRHAGALFRCTRLAGAAPHASAADLMRFALDPPLLSRFNPFLSDASRERLLAACRLWLQLCVLEDRLGRLVELAASDDDGPLALELLVSRVWDPAAHPEWLVFEAEGGLQARAAAAAVAAAAASTPLADTAAAAGAAAAAGGDPGAIVQLNMGEGKTRVILPMLALHLAQRGGGRIVRLNLLSQLLPEAFDHLHLYLTASALGRKLAVLPFNRDVQLTELQARTIAACVAHMRQEGGLLLVAPEWRLSLLLKQRELWHRARDSHDEAAAATEEVLEAVGQLPYVDLLDESDELLRHKWQLIYAWGSPQDLPSRSERVSAVLALLQLVSSDLAPSANGTLPPGSAVLEPVAAENGRKPPGSYSGLRLISGGELAGALPGVCRALAEALLARPPYELRWLRGVAGSLKASAQQLRVASAVLSAVTDASAPIEQQLGRGHLARLEPYQLAHLLALRGMLAGEYGVLAHALQRRHLVDYGVNRLPSARKRLAVPFRAAQTPSERAEFAHPDVALLLTALSYFRDGLTKAELKEALVVLTSLGPSAQGEVYREWLDLSKPDITEEELAEIDSELKIDVNYEVQASCQDFVIANNH
ncbi:hypothetical protein MNEG_1660 [Monoraphidium neglectum]|uniref:ubiquitinyl hydrolase 1 n=1 Tax=Monoraphidium neglectum TaxID=145388 RepID=A0A0D2NPF0_9CHLO|nr:hypothetical protein MNEG_1660 [Monoraphidium neglectum]KIZ06296.1 hypothetical protein MNEG_1660 [Monoraphidium neglectum]|eukprot:XP_013905315.1 hypothetical protein MNEG_1660 [Monoraphidium neglectum]